METDAWNLRGPHEATNFLKYYQNLVKIIKSVKKRSHPTTDGVDCELLGDKSCKFGETVHFFCTITKQHGLTPVEKAFAIQCTLFSCI